MPIGPATVLGGRPSRAEVEPAALRLIARYGPSVMATARRYAGSPEDAEDAYQRGLEILLTKAPSTRESDLLPWLKTVVKHEAFALRRQRERHGTPAEDHDLEPGAGHETSTAEQAERYDRLRLGAEALRRLKPQEVRCLLLRAEGFSYRQICEETGWTYTKVNRCLTEGRRSFLERVAGIETGAECERLAPALSALADGEASAEDMSALRGHLRGCLQCRAALREYRAAPRRVAALVPAAAIAGAPDEGPGALARALEWMLGPLQERVGALGQKAQAFGEAASAQKVAAVAASTAALAGGSAATVQTVDQARDKPPEQREGAEAPERTSAEAPVPSGPSLAELEAERRRAALGAQRGPGAGGTAAESPAADAPRAPKPAQTEFEAGAASPADPGASAPAPAPPPAATAPSGSGRSGSSGGAGEFAP